MTESICIYENNIIQYNHNQMYIHKLIVCNKSAQFYMQFFAI